MDPSAEKLLDTIEQTEFHSLIWGDVDAGLSEAETLALAKKCVEGQDQAEDLIEDLIDHRLLYEFVSSSQGTRPQFRSRFSEFTRLLVKLRQVFEGEDWRGAPRLVSDFRIDIRPRRFPDRNIDAVKFGQELASQGRLTDFQRNLWDALTSTSAGQNPFYISGFQSRSISRLIEPPPNSGTIITAGTGSGKTLAFYLPAFLNIATKISKNDFWTKAVAIYPTRELLKDQLTEAVRNARKLDEVLINGGKRPLIVGAYFGNMPNQLSATDEELTNKNWKVGRDGVTCPIIRCPRCDNDLIWPTQERNRRNELLICTSTKCDFKMSGDAFPLSRQGIQRTPPDILFTTFETLNTRMSDGWTRHIFGLGQKRDRRPNLVLLDEVHSYSDTTGAQVALLLRRWKKLLGSSVSFVGLSATLDEAPQFLHELCGVRLERIIEISPDVEDLIEEGAEYQLALRGDPVSQAALLSTSIQATMLLGRVLDPQGSNMSDGMLGSKLFVFTDDLDVTHRLYDDLLDAEAYTRFRKPDLDRLPLAALRASGQSEPVARSADGQLWRLAEQIGHNLNNRLIIGRTTSRDPGVTAEANVIVATKALEVGFNDPTVGAVLQHKSPRNAASFIQRRGRAGRPRSMRPISVTILSDYGRDRLNFQAYEHLFDPRLPAQRLPIKNQYILRSQAAFCLIDWLFEQCPKSERKSWLYKLLSQPLGKNSLKGDEKNTLESVKTTLQKLVQGDVEKISSLSDFVAKSLDLDAEVTKALLWQPPRALLLEVVPTLTRELFQNWENAFPASMGKNSFFIPYRPIPVFLPANLFSDLNLPEVRVNIPAATKHSKPKEEFEQVEKALRNLAPGRVTRRFADEHRDLAHWVPVDPSESEIDLELSKFSPSNEYVGHFAIDQGTSIQRIPVYRPHEINLERVTKSTALPTSQGRFVWQSDFESVGKFVAVDLPDQGPWSNIIAKFSFWLHRHDASVLVRRFATRAIANVRRMRQDESIVDIRVVDENGNPAAVGFEIDVDGLCLQIQLPTADELCAVKLPPDLLASTRTAFYRTLVEKDPEIPADVNSFLRDWLQQIFLSAAVLRAERNEMALGEAIESLRSEGITDPFEEVMNGVFSIQGSYEEPTAGEDDVEPDNEGRITVVRTPKRNRIGKLKQRLLEVLKQEVIQNCLAENLLRALKDQDEKRGHWLADVLFETLTQALLDAVITAAPQQTSLDKLIVDQDQTDSNVCLWLTETTLGGAGVIEALAEHFTSHPGRFLQALDSALCPNDLELAANGLAMTVGFAVEDTAVADQLKKVRSASGLKDRTLARDALTSILATRGVLVSHPLAVAISARLLRSGSSVETDKLLHNLVTRWDALEKRLGLSIGLREYAFIASELQPDVRQALEQMGFIDATAPNSRVVQILAGLLWPRGLEIRQKALQSYNPYRESSFADAALVRALLFEATTQTVSLEDPEWLDLLHAALRNEGSVRLASSINSDAELRTALLEVIATPVEVEPLLLYPAIQSIEQDGQLLLVAFALKEITGW